MASFNVKICHYIVLYIYYIYYYYLLLALSLIFKLHPLRPTLVVPVCGAAPLLAPSDLHQGPGLHVLLHTADDEMHSCTPPLCR